MTTPCIELAGWSANQSKQSPWNTDARPTWKAGDHTGLRAASAELIDAPLDPPELLGWSGIEVEVAADRRCGNRGSKSSFNCGMDFFHAHGTSGDGQGITNGVTHLARPETAPSWGGSYDHRTTVDV